MDTSEHECIGRAASPSDLQAAAPRKLLLLSQLSDAFAGRSDISLLGSLNGMTQAEADWRSDASLPAAEQIVRHIAWAKSKFCHDGFATPMVLVDEAVDDNGDSPGLPREFPCGAAFGAAAAPGIAGAIELLQRAHLVFTACLESCTEASLDQSIPCHHGKSALNFFWTLLMHDLYHAGQIRTRRTLYRITRGSEAIG